MTAEDCKIYQSSLNLKKNITTNARANEETKSMRTYLQKSRSRSPCGINNGIIVGSVEDIP